MTQSGQGEQPSSRPAREGIVLPSDGGEPLLPGMTSTPAGGSVPAQPPASAPPGGQTWGDAWGPGHQAPQQPQPSAQWDAQQPAPWGAQGGQGPSAGQQPATGQNPPPGRPGPGPLPPEGAQPGFASGGGSYDGHPGASGALMSQDVGQGHAAAGHAAPSQGGAVQNGAVPGGTQPGLPSGGVSYGGHTAGSAGPLPGTAEGGYGASVSHGAGTGHGAGAGAPLPPQAEGHGAPAQGYGSPGNASSPAHSANGYGGHPAGDAAPGAHSAYTPPSAGAPLPPVSPDGATQYLPPVPGGDEAATQYIPPVASGALPPEMPAGQGPSEAAYTPGRPAQGAPGGGDPDAEPTQYIPPVTDQPYGTAPAAGTRQPPAEFDNLFRSAGSGDDPAGATQQMPRVEEPLPGVRFDPTPSRGSRGSRGGGGNRSRVPLIAVAGVVIAAVGIGAGALLGGGDGDSDDRENRAVSATAPASQAPSPSPSADPAREQAVELDKLLADSGDSRTSVINAVADVKACRDLSQAAQDLRAAAKQRNQLVTDLSRLTVDQLPSHAALTTALTQAWKASASADNHYAAWADEVARKRGKMCKKGQARATRQTQAGNRASGTATARKGEAAALWNAIARKYGLTERQPTQL